MGNNVSADGEFANIELTAQPHALVAIDERFVQPADITRLLLDNAESPHSKDLAFKDPKSRKVVLRAGSDHNLRTLQDADKVPVVKVAKKRNVSSIYYVYLPVAAPETDTAGFVTAQDDDSELFQVYFKIGWRAKSESRDTIVRVDFSDRTTGERCRIDLEGDWRSHSAMLWLSRVSGNERSPVGRIFKPARAPRSDYYVEIAPNVDTALVLTICAVLDEELKREQRPALEFSGEALKNSTTFMFSL